ncbi:MAG: hypothetical protein PGN11_14265 [Quadrisphaera sp.]
MVGGFVAAVVAGSLLGLLTGTIVVKSRVNSFIGTLATSIIYRGMAVVITAGAIAYPLADQAEQFSMLTWPSLFGLTSATVMFVVVAVAARAARLLDHLRAPAVRRRRQRRGRAAVRHPHRPRAHRRVHHQRRLRVAGGPDPRLSGGFGAVGHAHRVRPERHRRRRHRRDEHPRW